MDPLSMDERLKDAAIWGDVAFLNEAIACDKPIEYFKLEYIPKDPDEEEGGNIFHLAARNQRLEFIRRAVEVLPFLAVNHLLKSINNRGKTPLDEDFLVQHNEIARVIEDLYERHNTMDRQLKNAAIQGDVEFLEQAVSSNRPIEYFTSRDFSCPTRKEQGGNIFHLAAYKGGVEFFKVAMKILPISEVDLDILLWQEDDTVFGDCVLDIAEMDIRCREIAELVKEIYVHRNSMEEKLKKAAIQGDVVFLREAVASAKPVEYFQSLCCVPDPDFWNEVGNIFHLAARNKRAEFVREAMEILPRAGVDVHLLLAQQDHPKNQMNPLHVAAYDGHDKVVKVLLDYYDSSVSASANFSRLSSSSSTQSTTVIDCHNAKPWFVKNGDGYTPFHYVMKNCREECALKMLSKDSKLFSHMDDCPGDEVKSSPFVLALQRGFSNVIWKYLESPPDWHTFDKRVLACALAYAPNCSDEIFILVLKQNLQVIKDGDFYRVWSPLEEWAIQGKLLPFECVLKDSCSAPHIRRSLVNFMWEKNPLYYVAKSGYDENRGVKIAKILVAASNEKREQSNSAKVEPLYFARDVFGETALHKAIQERRQKLALHFLSLEKIERLLGQGDPFLFLAIEHNCHHVAQKILDIVDQHGLKTLLTSNTGRTVLHDAPKCEGDFVRQLVKRYPQLVNHADDDGVTILHSWMEMGELRPFQCILDKYEFSTDVIRNFIFLLEVTDDKSRNPLHVAAAVSANRVNKIVRFLCDAIREPGSNAEVLYYQAVVAKDSEGNTPVDIALSTRREEFALCLLSELQKSKLLVYYNHRHQCLFKAIEKHCHAVVKFLLDQIHEHGWDVRDHLHREEQNVLHIASNCTVENAKLIVERWPKLIGEQDKDKKTPLERASEAGSYRVVKVILEKDSSSILKAPRVWIDACERGDLSTVFAFVEKSPYLKDLCRLQCDTPLHHIQRVDYRGYEEFLHRGFVKELKNTQNSQGETPLHVAIRHKKKELAEILLRMDDVDRTIKDKDGKTAMDLLEESRGQDDEWKEMCEIIGVDPTIRTPYIHVKVDLTHMRDIISLVAALLATITFTAGFTLPGGFENDSGEAILVKKAAFLVFLIADGYAMCCSMLVLFCIIWSMVCKRDQSSLLIDRSLVLLKQSLYGTLVAFMTGVYAVIHRQSLWAAIVIFGMCSLVVVTANRGILQMVVRTLIPAADKEYLQLLCCWKKKKQNPTPPHDESEVQETEPLNSQQESEPDSNV